MYRPRSLQVCIQTDQPLPPKPKPQPTRIEVNDSLDQYVDRQDSQQRKKQQKKIKELNQINKKLLFNLKQVNKKLDDKIAIARSLPKYSHAQREISSQLKNQLANTYKQVDNYKAHLEILRGKSMTENQRFKIIQLRNRVKQLDRQIQSLQLQSMLNNNILKSQNKALDSIKTQHQKRVQDSLTSQFQQLQQQLKKLKKDQKDTKQLYMQIQNYQVQLQKKVRQISALDQPLLAERRESQGEQHSQEQWKQLIQKHQQAQKLNESLASKIEQSNTQIRKQKKLSQQIERRLSQRQTQLQKLKRKLDQKSKISRSDSFKPNKRTKSNRPAQEINISLPDIHDKKKGLNSIPDSPSVKKWIRSSHYQQIGFAFPQSQYFSDRKLLSTHNLTKVVQIQVFSNFRDEPSAFIFTYVDTLEERIRSQLPEQAATKTKMYNSQLIRFDQEDYLKSIQGQITQQNVINSIRFTSLEGKTIMVGRPGKGKAFRLRVQQQQLPTSMYWRWVSKNDDINLCFLGCEVYPIW